MTDFERDGEFTIPGKCDGCGVQKELMIERSTNILTKGQINKIAHSVMNDSESAEPMGPIEDDLSIVSDIEQQRARIVQHIDLKDALIQDLEDKSREYSDACAGAVPAEVVCEGICYKFRICTSSLVYDPERPVLTPTLVEIQPVDEQGSNQT